MCIQCKWSSCDDLVVEEAGQGSDSQPAPWKDVLSNGEQQGKVDYVLSHHAFTKPDSGDEFRPVAGRGDRLAANDLIRGPGDSAPRRPRRGDPRLLETAQCQCWRKAGHSFVVVACAGRGRAGGELRGRSRNDVEGKICKARKRELKRDRVSEGASE